MTTISPHHRPGAVEGLDRFDVHHEVGRGAAGIVFRATDRESTQPVALKVLAQPDADESLRSQLLDEGAILETLDHPNIVRIEAYGTTGVTPSMVAGHQLLPGTPFIAMEWLEGADLEQRRRGGLTLPQSLECGRQVAAALAAAHSRGVVHRDVKPTNIIVLAEPPLRIKLVDFGVACEKDDIAALGPMVGTPAYMAPELAGGTPDIDPRVDVYSLGATLFELLVGRAPHVGPTPIATLAKAVSTPAPRLHEVLLDAPVELEDLVAAALALEVAERPTAASVESGLAGLLARADLPDRLRDLDQQSESVHSSVSRLVTALVALGLGTPTERDVQLGRLRERGAEAAALGRDALVAYFGAKRAHGQEAETGIELGRSLAQDGAGVGVATGRALVELARPVGEVVDKASALAREAEGGVLLADEVTAELSRNRYQFESTPSSSAPSSAWQVVDRVPERRDVPEATPFVSRTAELETLFSAFERSADSHQPVVVTVTGPPGIGKSRLSREFVRRMGDVRLSLPPVTEPSAGTSGGGGAPDEVSELRVLQVRCEAYGRSRALGTAADMLIELLGLAKGSAPDDVDAALIPLSLVHDEGRLLRSLLAGEPFGADVDPNRARDILYLAMTELVHACMGDDPMVVLVDDIQWSDPESVAWFDHLLSRSSGRSLYLLALARPLFWKGFPRLFTGRDHVRVELRPIPRRATMEIAKAVIGCERNDPMLAQVARQAAGSPLFAEELARVLSRGQPVTTVPTIEAAIQVSLDALDEDARLTIAMMSVFGLTSWDRGLAAAGIPDVDAVLLRLIEADLVVEQALSRFPQAREFWFKHALVRDVAYQSTSEAMRQQWHAVVAEWLARVGEDAATVAEHYDLGQRQAAAAGFWEKAARRALTANALTDAVKMADRALTFAEEDRDFFSRASLLDEIFSRLDERAAERGEAIESMETYAYDEASRTRARGARARYDHARSAGSEVEERLLEVVQRSADLGLKDEQARALATLATRYAFAGELDRAANEAARLLELAEHGVPPAAVDAHQALAVVHQTRGELAAALEARRNAARAARAAGLKQREATLTINLGFALTTIGARDEARREIAAGIRMAEEIGSAGTVRLGRMVLLGWAAHFDADPSLEDALAEPRTAADEAAAGAWIVRDRVTLGVLFYRGCELLLNDDRTSLGHARSLLKVSADAYRQTDNRDVLPVALGYWAEAERRSGELETAETIAKEAADLVDAGAPSLLNEAIIYLALHGARVDQGKLSAAHRAIERGMEPLLRRTQGLRGTAYERAFLALSHNARLIEAADVHGCLPEELHPMIA